MNEKSDTPRPQPCKGKKDKNPESREQPREQR